MAGSASTPVESSGAAGPEQLRPLRADAARNRARILQAAEEIFAADGMAVPIDAVAERAGVGVGTLYRHFPTKEALFEAIVVNRLDNLVESARGYEAAADPATGLFACLGQLAQQAAAKHDLFEALLTAGVDVKSRCATQLQQLLASVDRLRTRAARAGLIRRDVTAEELVSLMVGACQTKSETKPDQARIERMVAIITAGLRTTNPADPAGRAVRH